LQAVMGQPSFFLPQQLIRVPFSHGDGFLSGLLFPGLVVVFSCLRGSPSFPKSGGESLLQACTLPPPLGKGRHGFLPLPSRFLVARFPFFFSCAALPLAKIRCTFPVIGFFFTEELFLSPFIQFASSLADGFFFLFPLMALSV